MRNELIRILKSIKETVGIDTVAYSSDGALLYRSADVPQNDMCFSRGQKEVTQTQDGRCTVLPLKDGTTVVLMGAGAEYTNYALLLKTLIEGQAHTMRELTTAEKLKLYLLRELDAEYVKELTAKYEPPFDCYVLTLVTDSMQKLSELRNLLETMRERNDLIVPYDETAVALIKRCGEEDEYQSATDFASTLYDNIKEELRINVTVNVGGTVHDFADVPEYFRRCAMAYAFGRLLNPNEKIYSYKEYIMAKMLSDIPLDALGEYLRTLLDKDSAEILEDEELMMTADSFMKNSLNISETSRSMYMHRNTLIYRLDKIETATGLNLRHFNDAVAFRLLTVLNMLVQQKLNGENPVGKK